jgi:hypothetical protein
VSKEEKLKEQAIKPEIVITTLLDEIAYRLSKIENILKAEHPEGYLGHYEDTITDKIKEWEPPDIWFSGSLYNYGPNTVYVQTNDIALDFVPVELNENLEFDFKTAKIKKIYFKCNKGETAKIKIIGKY